MKVKNYEKKNLVVFFTVFFLILELIFFLVLTIKKTYSYDILSGIVMKKDLVIVVVSKKERNLLSQNKFLNLDDKKMKYKILEDHGPIISKGKEKYYEIILKFSFPREYKANDILTISLKNKKYQLIEIFKIIWEGDKN